MWAFYGYSKPFAITLGILEITGGILMLIKRTRLVGCLLVTSILVNVILQDIFYSVNIGALRAAIIYQFFIIIIFWFNKDRVLQCFKILTKTGANNNSRKKYLVILLFSATIFVLLRILEYYITMKW